MEEQLTKVREALVRGEPSPQVTVREFLWWNFAQRRGYWIVRSIRQALKKHGLTTEPDFEYAWIDSEISFALLRASPREAADDPAPNENEELITIEGAVSGSETTEAVWVSREAAYRVSRLAAAHQSIVFVSPDERLPQIITKMMSGGYSQLPVMTNERTVKGIVSWQSIGSRLAMGVNVSTANDVREDHHEIMEDKSIFEAIPIIVSNDYVLVRNSSNMISGIITASDLSLQFRELTEPFLLLSEIENLVRNLIGQNFDPDELKEACDDRDTKRVEKVESVANLNFGEYIRLLQHPDRWSKLGLSVDRQAFCSSLDSVREIRNDVMHFDPDGISENSLRALRDFTRFLQQLARITGKYRV